MADPRVTAAIEHWAPRFLQAGVPVSDFQATTSRTERWEDWLDEWTRTGDEHAARAETWEGECHLLSAGEAWARAAVCYHFARFVWVLDMDRHLATGLKATSALYRAHTALASEATRIEAPLRGSKIVANLRRPAGVERPPLVILIPGLDSTKEEFFTLEQAFVDREMAAASIDGPGQGETGATLPISHDYEAAVGALLDALERRPDIGVDLDRVGAVGVSLGGYYAARAAAFEPRIKAVCGISGPFAFQDIWDALPPLSRTVFTAKSFSRSEAEAREKAAALDLVEAIQQLRQPFLAVTGKLDRLVPWEDTKRQADLAPNGEFLLHDDGNHGCANVEHKTRPVIADWIRDHLA